MPGNIAHSFKKAFTRRYCVALGLIFCILLSTFLAFTRQTQMAENDAYLINISGMQRMLSQRIALMAKEVRRAQNEAEADQFADKLEAAITRMYANNAALTTGDLKNGRSYRLSPALQEMYFGEAALDERVGKYLLAAKSFHDMYKERGLDVIKAAIRAEDNVAFARRGLLADLDSAVKLYEGEAKGRIRTFRHLELVFFIIGLVILLGEVLFIFRPMVHAITSRIGALEAKNAELVELSKKLVSKHPPQASAAAKPKEGTKENPPAS
ncbi:MAG: type IV pili methyl-accepting chemotaxis transducer N-terminal domain-containing protein [Pseudomonadota bacterium]